MKKTLIAAVAIMALAGCNKNVLETPSVGGGYGYIDLGITADSEIVVVKGITSDADLDDFNITLNNTASGQVWTGEYSEVANDASKWTVPAGGYTVYVENLTDAEAHPKGNMGFVRVAGTSPVINVTEGSTQKAPVACNPVNSKVSCIYTAKFKEVFGTSAEVVLDKASRNLSMVMTEAVAGGSQTYGSQAYFPADADVEWELTATPAGGQEKTYRNTFTTQANRWSVIKFDVSSGGNGMLNITVSVNDEITEVVPIDATINPLG